MSYTRSADVTLLENKRDELLKAVSHFSRLCRHQYTWGKSEWLLSKKKQSWKKKHWRNSEECEINLEREISTTRGIYEGITNSFPRSKVYSSTPASWETLHCYNKTFNFYFLMFFHSHFSQLDLEVPVFSVFVISFDCLLMYINLYNFLWIQR